MSRPTKEQIERARGLLANVTKRADKHKSSTHFMVSREDVAALRTLLDATAEPSEQELADVVLAVHQSGFDHALPAQRERVLELVLDVLAGKSTGGPLWERELRLEVIAVVRGLEYLFAHREGAR